MRSINTTVVALLPVAGLLFVGGGVLGAGMLNDISLALFVGLAAGAYSSIFIATPLVADLKDREPEMKALAKRVKAKRAAAEAKGASQEEDVVPAPADAEDGDDGTVVGPRSTARLPQPRPRPPVGQAPMTAPAGLRELLLSRIADVPDHPQPGVVFKDITPLLDDPAAFGALTEAFVELCERHRVDKVVGLEARGFILAAPVAIRATAVGFVPVRKAYKLPRATLRQAYELEYGTAEIEIHADALAPGERVLVIDDVLATGGTADASLQLIRRAGAEVAGVAVLLELDFLAGRQRLEPGLKGAPLEVLITV